MYTQSKFSQLNYADLPREENSPQIKANSYSIYKTFLSLRRCEALKHVLFCNPCMDCGSCIKGKK